MTSRMSEPASSADVAAAPRQTVLTATSTASPSAIRQQAIPLMSRA